MKVLCTGAAGFIGKHVTKKLLEEGHDVITLDMPYYASMDLAVDISKPLDPIPDLDAVIHLAALSHPRQCDDNATKAFDVNVNGTHQVLKMALESGAKKFVFSSSAHVYDIPPRYLPTDEVHPLRLNNTYTTTKILGEQLCELYWTNYGLSYTVLRLFNAYGHGQSIGYFIPDMLAKSRDIDLGVGGHTTKDWVWVEDVAAAFVLALGSNFVGPINIGTGVETPLHQIAGRIASEHGFVCKTAVSDITSRMCADSSRAKAILGWSPAVSLEEGLSRVIQVPVGTIA